MMVSNRWSRAGLAAAALSSGLAAACGGASSNTTGPTASEPASDLPHFDDLEPGVTSVIKPGGDTICSRGGEFAFVVRPGAKDKVILEFEGGGACWDEKTCGLAGSIFKETIDVGMYTSGSQSGWYDQSRPEHPMKGWTHVYIPYCTGDIHWGDNVKTYGEGDGAVTINHKGAVNVRAALDWVYKELASPQKVFVTGCSAGGYGSIWWAPEVQHHYTSARVYHFADSAAGVITKDFFEKSFPAWNAQATFPSFLGDYKAANSLPALYKIAASYYPDNVYSQYNTVLDENQTFFFVAMGGSGKEDWSAQMKASVKTIEGTSPGFHAFLAEGEQHCILPYNNFYTVEAGGKKLTQWLSDMVNDKPVTSAYCEGCSP